MATEVAQLPHIEVFHRVMELPMVESAISKSAATYLRVKDCHQLVHWALTTAEISLSNATKQAVPIAAPIAKKLENPIHFVDHTLCLGLDKIEEKVPLVKEKPEQILENAYTLARQTVQPAVSSISLANEMIISQALSLRDISWNKANQILETQYGSAAVRGLDSTADVVNKLIDKYFPATGDEQSIVIQTNEEDKLLHTLQTVGRLSNKAARRVYSTIILHLRTINTENLKSYIKSLVQFLQLTNHHGTNNGVQVHAINSKSPDTSDTSNADSKKVN
ncbi:Lipid storage droplets surface-binding protein 2 [Eufriesea mexicana]|uniref:lipid storage droplets surface-binding protein 2-like n=1 Tax=Eufriesea mexicana TaxID=516756 RepID=UPI00083C78E6|nr:PREDICTED: lipid storage droplets surface-binding protein 2-like [Eufriesea mexicana]XP_017759218.1 PREDICTED: lipid storage droplets surface-binding protein 2-like [Eufriesea mexicana]OAD55825.1 Lipid storage droplets surface-binding protein 2 [Eufriesea mexicana]